jgi:hypothetical protein
MPTRLRTPRRPRLLALEMCTVLRTNRKQVHDPHEGALRPCCTLRLSGHAGSGRVV